MDFDLELLLWLLIPLFGLLGRKKKKKKQPAKQGTSTTETVAVEQAGKPASSNDPFKEALRQIKEALGEARRPESPTEKPREAYTQIAETWPAEDERHSEFHEHAFPTRENAGKPVVLVKNRFESFDADKSDRFVNLERSEDKKSTARKLMEQPALSPRERRKKKVEDDDSSHLFSERFWARTKDLQRAFVWREILGPPRSRSHRIR